MKQRIVILGDSLSMPRRQEGLTYQDTYPYLLEQSGYDVINRSKRANDTFKQNESLNLSDDISDFEADIIVIHLGIVDCAPRIFTKKESKILSILPLKIRKIIITLFSKYRKQITRFRNISYVTAEDFEINLTSIVEHIGIEKKIVLIKILDTNNLNKRKSFNFDKNIEIYNKVIEKVALQYRCTLIDPNLLNCKNKLLPDGIHITPKLHLCLTNEIVKKLQ